jgi:hypothetical protein
MIEVVRQRYSMTPAQIDLVRKSFDALWPFRNTIFRNFFDAVQSASESGRELVF